MPHEELYIVRGKAVSLAVGEGTEEPGRYRVQSPLAPTGFVSVGFNAFYTKDEARRRAERNASELKQRAEQAARRS